MARQIIADSDGNELPVNSSLKRILQNPTPQPVVPPRRATEEPIVVVSPPSSGESVETVSSGDSSSGKQSGDGGGRQIPIIAPGDPTKRDKFISTGSQILDAEKVAAAEVVNVVNQAYPRIFTRFTPDDIVLNNRRIVSEGMWSNGTGILLSHHTSSTELSSSKSHYFFNVYGSAPTTSSTPPVEYTLSFGNVYGSGSIGTLEDTPSKAIYSSLRNVLLNPGDTKFTKKDGVSMDSIYVMTFPRSRVKDRIDPGNFEVNLHINTSSFSFIDDSDETITNAFSSGKRVFNIVSGSIINGVNASTANQPYGLFYPDMGIVIFDAQKLHDSHSLTCNTGSDVNVKNHVNFYEAIRAASNNGNGLKFRNEQTINLNHYFVRIKNRDYNYSNNPTFISGSNGDIVHKNFYKNPTVYVTTIGLYNDNYELLAVAKFNKPVPKTFETEINAQINLRF